MKAKTLALKKELPRLFTSNRDFWHLTVTECNAVKIRIKKKAGGYLIRENRGRRFLETFTHDYRQAEAAIRQFLARYPALKFEAYTYTSSYDVHLITLTDFAPK